MSLFPSPIREDVPNLAEGAVWARLVGCFPNVLTLGLYPPGPGAPLPANWDFSWRVEMKTLDAASRVTPPKE